MAICRRHQCPLLGALIVYHVIIGVIGTDELKPMEMFDGSYASDESKNLKKS